MKHFLLILTLGFSFASAYAADDDQFSAPERNVTLDASSRGKLGIVTAPAKASNFRSETQGFGQILTIDALGQTDADLSVAEATAQASAAALARAEGLFKADTSVSRQVLETAQRQAVTDAAQLTLAQRKAVATWGREGPWQDAAKRHALLRSVATDKTLLVRATLPASATIEGDTAIRIERLGLSSNAKGLKVSSVWSAPADPTLPGRSYFILLEGPTGLSQGERVRVSVSGGKATAGAIVPPSAIIIAEGQTWLYVEEKPNYFVRQAIDLSQSTSNGYFVPHGVNPGEKVVTEGAAHLLAKETGSEE